MGDPVEDLLNQYGGGDSGYAAYGSPGSTGGFTDPYGNWHETDGGYVPSGGNAAQAAADAARAAQMSGASQYQQNLSGYTPPPPQYTGYDPEVYARATDPNSYDTSYGTFKRPEGMSNNDVAQMYFDRARQQQLLSPQLSDADAYNAGASRETMAERRRLQEEGRVRFGTNVGGGGGGYSGGGGGGGAGGSGGGGGSGGAGGGAGSGGGSTTTVTNTRGREAVYYDIPSDEEFLNDFNTAYGTYLSGLMSAGQLNSVEVNWLLGNSDVVYTAFIAEQGRRAERGEDIFGVLNPEDASAAPTKIGERQGDQRTTVTNSVQTSAERPAEQTPTQTIPSSVVSSVGWDGSGSNGAAAANWLAGQSTQAPVSSMPVDTVNTSKNINNVDIKEDVFTRPKIGVGYKYSPGEYLKGEQGASRLKMLYEGQRNSRYASQRTEGRRSVSRVY